MEVIDRLLDEVNLGLGKVFGNLSWIVLHLRGLMSDL